MNKSSEEKMIRHLRSAAGQLTPNQADALWEKPVARATEGEWFLEGTEPKTHAVGRMTKVVGTLAACFLICIVSVMVLYMQSNAAIYLDVNPSVEVKINRFDRVLSAKASNDDGSVILEDMELKNVKLDVAMNAILGSMVKHGYLTDTASTVLVSVECDDQKRADQLRIQVSSRIEEDMGSMLQSGTVLSQKVTTDDDLVTLADRFGMTKGKAALLRRLASENPGLVFEQMAKLSMSELEDFLEQQGIHISDDVEDQMDALEESGKPDVDTDDHDPYDDPDDPDDDPDDPDDDLDVPDNDPDDPNDDVDDPDDDPDDPDDDVDDPDDDPDDPDEDSDDDPDDDID